MQKWVKRLLAALLLVGPPLVIALVFLYAPKAETPRDEALPEGDLTLIAQGPVHDGGPDHPAEGEALLYWNGTGYLLRFEDYEAESGPNVWFYAVPNGTDAVEDEGLLLRVPGPGQATYRGTFHVPLPSGFDPEIHTTIVAWDRTLDEPFAHITLTPADIPRNESTGNGTRDAGASTQHP